MKIELVAQLCDESFPHNADWQEIKTLLPQLFSCIAYDIKYIIFINSLYRHNTH